MATLKKEGVDAEKNDEPAVEPYSSFSPLQKSLLIYAASISATFSGLSSFIYYPAITAIAKSLSKPVVAINLTITSYLVVAGIAPSILGDLADRVGRRPISIVALTIYLGANLGLAIQNNYTALVVLRCLQSAGASSTIAIAYGIIADVSIPAERGTYMGILMGFTNAAPSLGPVIGGVLAQQLSWHWIFWLLAILGGTHLLALMWFLPETSRKKVGNGGREPIGWMSRSFYSRVSRRRSPKVPGSGSSTPFFLPNPFSCLVALVDRSNFIVLFVGGLGYTVFGCLAASLSAQMINLYSLNYLTGGLLYLPSGIGGVLAAYMTGRLLNRDYRAIAFKYGSPVTKSNDIAAFPIEEARLRWVFLFLALTAGGAIGYGWTLQRGTHMALPLVMQFVTGSTSVATFAVCGTLLTDLNPERSATIQASYNLVRCVLSGVGVGLLQPVINGIGIGWCFTIYAMIGALGIPLFVLLRVKGPQWREMKGPNKRPKMLRIPMKSLDTKAPQRNDIVAHDGSDRPRE